MARRFGIAFTVSPGAYRKAMKKIRASRKVWLRHNPDPRKRRRGMMLPAGVRDPATNRDRAVVELFRFKNRKRATPFVAYLKGSKVTNWTGLRICDVTSRKEGRRGFHASKIVTVQARCVDGRSYVGTGPGDGMYLRLRPKR